MPAAAVPGMTRRPNSAAPDRFLIRLGLFLLSLGGFLTYWAAQMLLALAEALQQQQPTIAVWDGMGAALVGGPLMLASGALMVLARGERLFRWAMLLLFALVPLPILGLIGTGVLAHRAMLSEGYVRCAVSHGVRSSFREYQRGACATPPTQVAPGRQG